MPESPLRQTYFCWLCSQPIDLETCKTDECGQAVHEDCYVLKMALANASTRVMETWHNSSHTRKSVVRDRLLPEGPVHGCTSFGIRACNRSTVA